MESFVDIYNSSYHTHPRLESGNITNTNTNVLLINALAAVDENKIRELKDKLEKALVENRYLKANHLNLVNEIQRIKSNHSPECPVHVTIKQ